MEKSKSKNPHRFVYWHVKAKKYQVKFQVGGRTYCFGLFLDPDEASEWAEKTYKLMQENYVKEKNKVG